MMSPHGIPVDLLDRLVIIRTLQYVLEEIIAILNTRAKVCLPSMLFLYTLHMPLNAPFLDCKPTGFVDFALLIGMSEGPM